VLKKTSKVKPPSITFNNDCLLWTGCKRNGYGLREYKGKQYYAHRLSWMIAHDVNDIPKTNDKGEALEIRHLCNVQACIEPTHLTLGTKAENGKDRSENPHLKARGETHCQAKITEELARQIKHSKDNGSQTERATIFNVPISIVKDIDYGTTWAHISDKNGVIDTHNYDKCKKKRAQRKKQLKTEPWTDEQWQIAERKLLDPSYTRRHDTTDNKANNGVACLEWMRCCIGEYGSISIHGQRLSAHVLACTIGNNRIRPTGLQASHKCGFSKCVEKTHLEFKTPQNNNLDRHEHGTMRQAQFSKEDVLEIRRLHKEKNMNARDIAKFYPTVSVDSVYRVISRRHYDHL